MPERNGSRPKRNYRRRVVGALLLLLPVWLLVASLVVGLGSTRENRLGDWQWIGAAAILPIPVLNCYLAFIRPRLYGARVGYRNISGIPLFGTLLVIVFGWLAFGDWLVATTGLVALALDTGGLPWFLIATWRDESFWDA